MAELEAEVKQLTRENMALSLDIDEMRSKLDSIENATEDRIAKRLHDALGIVFEKR